MSISRQRGDDYHHGDLRNALIAAGVDLLRDEGIQALSLRKLARSVGVSHNAPYMHFADKDALLAAIATEGFRALIREVAEALAAAGPDWPERLQGVGQAYVGFALSHVGHIQVMFREMDAAAYPDLQAAAREAFALLQGFIEEGRATGQVGAVESRDAAAMVWSLLHGISVILISHKMPPGVMADRSREEVVERFLALLWRGLGRVDATP